MRERRVETETETEKEKEVVNVQERGQDQGTKIVAVTAKATRREEVEAGEWVFVSSWLFPVSMQAYN